jgi:hypothetical protein
MRRDAGRALWLEGLISERVALGSPRWRLTVYAGTGVQSGRLFGSAMHIPAVATCGMQGVIGDGRSCKGLVTRCRRREGELNSDRHSQQSYHHARLSKDGSNDL